MPLYTRLKHPNTDLNELEIPPTIEDSNKYVDGSSNLRNIYLRVEPIEGKKRHLFGFGKSAYDGSVSDKFWKPLSTELIHISVIEPNIGGTYEFHIIGEDYESHAITEHVKFEVRSQRSPRELTVLYNNIFKLIEKDGDNAMISTTIHRDIDPYPGVMGPDNTLQGMIKPTRRTKSGHPANIAFDRFDMIYFNTSNMTDSYYGTRRLTFPPSCIFDNQTVLFLADMHCYWGRVPHYITLAAVNINTFAFTEIVRLGARQLNINDNPFLTYDSTKDELKVATQLRLRNGQNGDPIKVIVEVMVANRDLDIALAIVTPVFKLGECI